MKLGQKWTKIGVKIVSDDTWPLPTQLIHPTKGGKWSLLVQNDGVKVVVQGAITLALQDIAFKDSFPSGEQKVKMQQDSLYHAASDGGYEEIAHRLTQDRNYGKWLSTIVHTLLSLFSGVVHSRTPCPELSLGYLAEDRMREKRCRSRKENRET